MADIVWDDGPQGGDVEWDPQPVRPKPRDAGVLDAANRAFGRGAWALPSAMTAGLLSNANVQGAYNYLTRPKTSDPKLGLSDYIAAQKAAENRAEAAHPWVTGIVSGVGEAPAAALAGPVLRGEQVAEKGLRAITPLLKRSLESAKVNAGMMGLLGYGMSNADTAGGKLMDTGASAAGGAMLGTLTPTPVTPMLPEPINGSPGAQRLWSEGVGLSEGQKNRTGWRNQIEEAMTSLPFVGPMIEKNRLSARNQYTNMVINKGKAPGTDLIPDGPIAGQVDAMLKGYGSDTGYAPFQGVPINISTIGKRFSNAINTSEVIAGQDVRDAVTRELTHQLSISGRAALQNGGKDIPSEVLLAMRSRLRDAIRSEALGAGKMTPKARIYKVAEKELTSVIEDGFAGAAQKAETAGNKEAAATFGRMADDLRGVDAQYHKAAVIADAVARAGDQPGGMTPSHLSDAVAAATTDLSYARGGGGELRELARAGKEVFDTVSRPTGQRLALLKTMSRIPGAQPYIYAGTRQAGVSPFNQSLAKPQPTFLPTIGAQTEAELLAEMLRKKGEQ